MTSIEGGRRSLRDGRNEADIRRLYEGFSQDPKRRSDFEYGKVQDQETHERRTISCASFQESPLKLYEDLILGIFPPGRAYRHPHLAFSGNQLPNDIIG